jgi:hypothetical protein
MDLRKLYADFTGVKSDAYLRDQRAWLASKRNKAPSIDQFMDRVAKAMRRGDIDELGDVSVNTAAKKLRSQIDKSFNDLKKLDLLPEDLNVKFAKSWLARKYNRTAINRGLTNAAGETFFERIHRHMRDENPGLSAGETKALATKTYDNILGLGDEQIEANALAGHVLNGGKGKSFLKERVLTLEDTELEPWLDSDALGITFGFVNQAQALVATTRKFEEMSSQLGKPITSVADINKLLRDEMKELIEKADTPDAKFKLAQQGEQAQKEIIQQWDMVNGRFGTNNYHGLQKLRKLNAMMMLGGIALSSIPDIFMTVFKNGMPSVWKNGIVKTLKNFNKAKLARQDMQNLSGVIETHMNGILRAQTDPSFTAKGISNTPWDRSIDVLSDFFTSVTGINPWNRMVSSVGAELHATALVDDMLALRSTGKLSDASKARWARNGIGEKQYHIINRNLKHVDNIDGVNFINIRNWDVEAQELVSNSILRDQTVLIPKRGDIPQVFQEGDIGRTLFQFKSFSAAAHNKILMAGTQRAMLQGNAGLLGNEVQGIVGLISMGAFVYVIKEKIAGREPDLSVDRLIVEGFARSGVGGLITDPAMLFLPNARSTRFAGQNAMGLIGGPSLAQAARIVELSNGVFDGDIDDKDLQKAVKFIPFNNLFYLRGLLQATGD